MSALRQARKIGLFGGTFDPVHKGHLAVARHVLAQYCLDEIIFIPAPYPPHKSRPLTGFDHRVAMLEAALAGEPATSISLLEAERNSPSYTIDTLLELRQRIGDNKFYLIIGADSFVEVHLWYRFQDLFELTDLIVAARPGIERDAIGEQVGRLGRFQYDPEQDVWSRDDGFCIFYHSAVHVDLSSSEIRSRLIQGVQAGELLHPDVAAYVNNHQLYARSV